ncbi:MAG: nucleotidyltransferase domain-containing protein, partial [Candidatus Hodarchaeota archaeon]
INTFVRKVREHYHNKIEKIILFGSYARGEVREESDIDLLAITYGKRFEIQEILSGIAIDILLEIGVYISAKVVTTEEYDLMKELNTGFYQYLTREGVMVG